MNDKNIKRIEQAIRRLAKKDHLIATKTRKDGAWYIADEKNYLQSTENGMTAAQALEWLRSDGK